MSRRLMIIAGAIVALGAVVAWWTQRAHPVTPDAALLSTFANVSAISAYTQHVATETDIAGRHLAVEGVYHLDRVRARFASSATTTLTIPDTASRIFNLMNVSIGEDVYVKIETDDELLRSRIPHSPDWRHFTRTQIPNSFADIAIVGPILDNLLLFSSDGSYLRLVENHGESYWDDEKLRHYTFVLAGSQHPGGTLQTLMERIGDGTIDAWIDADRGEVRHMVIVGDAYHSTTTFANFNHIPSIGAPALAPL